MKKQRTYLPNKLHQLGQATKNSWISLVIIFLVFGLTLLGQSDTIVISLLHHDVVSLLLFFILLVALTIIIIHYPLYVEFQSRDKNGENLGIIWKMDDSPKFLGLGFIQYEPRIDTGLFPKFFRNFLGLLFLTMIFYAIGHVHHRTASILADGNETEFFKSRSFLCTFHFWLYPLFNVTLLWQLIDPGKYTEFVRRPIRKISILINAQNPKRGLFLIVSLLLIAALVSTCYISAKWGWSWSAYVSFCLTMWLAMWFVLVLSVYRKDIVGDSLFRYLKIISSSGFLSLILIAFAHFDPFRLNSLVLFLAYFNIFYGLLVIPIKHFLYYRQFDQGQLLQKERTYQSAWSKPAYILFSWIYPYATFSIFVYLVLFQFTLGNNLHLLNPVPNQKTTGYPGRVDYREFRKEFEDHFADKDTLYFVASYGGGIKASIWNLMVLKKLDSMGILDKTVAMSGVSGGTVGQAIYGGFQMERGEIKDNYIRALSEQNFVGVDFTYLFGHDLLFGQLPDWLLNVFSVDEDRAKRAMKSYAEFIYQSKASQENDNLLETTFQDYWSKLFRRKRKKQEWYPALIWNSAGTNTKRGISFSVALPDSLNLDEIFFDSIDLSNTGDSALSYLHAASTSDRFPIFSPSAKIEGKGYYLDGGYFENSGLLSLSDFADFFLKRALGGQWAKKKIFFIQIANDPGVYTSELLKNPHPEIQIKNSPEFGSILTTVTSIMFVPNYLNRKYEDLNSRKDTMFCYCQIQLPYLLLENDLKSYYGASRIQSPDSARVHIQTSNEMILKQISARPYVYVQPPLARMLGQQAYEYMKINLDGSFQNCLSKMQSP